jgi:XRE family aerobic/anaerobic benzoate catabolism transcriptional regulator
MAASLRMAGARAPSASARLSDTEFLRRIGGRVRAEREARGLTRRALASASDVSERYLALLESGAGNASVLILRRVASALSVAIEALLLADGVASRSSAQRRRVALIGLRGAGKTTLGALLARKLGVSLIEMSREIRRDTGLPVSEVMALYGPAGYRRIERTTLERLLRDVERGVLVAGGGIVTDDATFDLLLSTFHTIWLRARPEEHMARVLAQGDFRPMAGHREAMEDLKRILAAREPMYRRAHAIVDTSGDTPEQSLRKLASAIAVQTQDERSE